MSKCPVCTEETEAAAVKCKHCGEILVPDAWRSFCRKYRTLSADTQRKEYEKLTDDQKRYFHAAWAVLEVRNQQQDAPLAGKTPQSHGRSDSRKIVAFGCLFFIAIVTVALLMARLSNRESRSYSDKGSRQRTTVTSPSRIRIENESYADAGDVRQARAFLSKLPAACNRSRARAATDGTGVVSILIKQRGRLY
jgi:hypothetical protein